MKLVGNKKFMICMIALMTMMAILTGCSGSSETTNEQADTTAVQQEPIDPLDFFGENNLVGKTMEEIEGIVGELEAIAPEDGGTWSGGQWFRASTDVAVAFDYSEMSGSGWEYGEEVIDKSIICTGTSGTPDNIFGMDAAATIDDVEAALELELEKNMMEEGSYAAEFTYNGINYGIVIYPFSETTNGHNCSIDIISR